jgi:hypothetical protein
MKKKRKRITKPPELVARVPLSKQVKVYVPKPAFESGGKLY